MSSTAKFNLHESLSHLEAFLILPSGVENIAECPSQPWIPIFLMAQGVASIILISLMLTCFISCNDGEKATHWFRCMTFFIVLVTLALITWHFVGSYWVFGLYQQLQVDGSCASNCYMLAFVLLVVCQICYGTIVLSLPCVLKERICEARY